MNNEPVAWMDKKGNCVPEDVKQFEANNGDWFEGYTIPLYTHPATEHFEDEPQAEELFEIMESNNQPVAWVDELCLALIHKCKSEWVKVYREKKDDEYIPLYTHPAKTLTDEEIIKTMVQFDVYSADDQCLIDAGRAILKKAGER